jgi:hypothetical protein
VATISITVPNAVLTRVVDGVCGSMGYQDTIGGVANPETRAQFAQRMLREWVKARVRAWETSQAETSAGATAGANVDSQIVLT